MAFQTAALVLVTLVGSATTLETSPASSVVWLGEERRGDDCSYAAAYPRQYVAYKTSQLNPSSLDGDLTKQVWAEVAWTEDFVDISTKTIPRLRTRAKIRWDDEWLYVAAELEEPEAWATLKQHDTVIYQDNDFEIFVDAAGTTHWYKEYEMNALNTTWDLCLNKPYNDGGHEISARVTPGGFDMQPPLRSAALVVPSGSLNDPAHPSTKWTVEVALPVAVLSAQDHSCTAGGSVPKPGSIWRINFSRVEWGLKIDRANNSYIKAPSCQSCPTPGAPVEDNWVWSPQGEIAMHLPERWAILQFADANVNATEPVRYGEWPSRGAAMAIYYAEHAYAQAHGGNYTDSLEDLLPFSAAPFQLCPSAQTTITLQTLAGAPSFLATATSPASPEYAATVRSDRLLLVASTERRV